MTAKINCIIDGSRIGYRRQQPSGEWIWCDSRTDDSPAVRHADYTESCSLCYLGQAHTLDAHNSAVVRWNQKMAS